MRNLLLTVLAAALACAAPVQADEVDEIRASAALIHDCLEITLPGKELECLGKAEAECLMQEDYGPAVTEACARLERRAWDILLNETFTKLQVQTRDASVRARQRADQATWAESRDRELATAVSPAEDEYVRDTALARLASRLAAQRIIDLTSVSD